MSALRAALRHWHRRIGVGASLFLIWLAVSGVLLNESPRFGLDHIRIAAPWLMDWYGLHAEPPAQGYLAEGHWLIETDDATLLDGKALAPTLHGVRGFEVSGDRAHPLLVIAIASGLALLTADGQPVETLDAGTLPMASIRRIGTVADGRLAIQDLDAYASADSGETWTKLAAGEAVVWSALQRLPEPQRAAALPYARPSLSLLRVLADAHSGRLFGRFGPTVIDLAALAAVLLAGSGVWMVWRASRRAHHGHRSH